MAGAYSLGGLCDGKARLGVGAQRALHFAAALGMAVERTPSCYEQGAADQNWQIPAFGKFSYVFVQALLHLIRQ
eukprot:scaffold157499_cov12-Tisochrysis_lutea.AAC.1